MHAVLVHPAAENATLDELRVAMEGTPNQRLCIRLGIDREIVAQQCCRIDRSVRLWIALFNRGGMDPLIARPKSGRPRKVKQGAKPRL